MMFDRLEQDLLYGLTNDASYLEDIEEEQEEILHEEAEADEESREVKLGSKEVKSKKDKAQRKRKNKDSGGFRIYTPKPHEAISDFCPIRFWINVTLLVIIFIGWLVYKI